MNGVFYISELTKNEKNSEIKCAYCVKEIKEEASFCYEDSEVKLRFCSRDYVDRFKRLNGEKV